MLEWVGLDTPLGRFTAAVQQLGEDGPPLEILDNTIEKTEAHTLLSESPRVYRAEPTALWDDSLDSSYLDRDWVQGDTAADDLRKARQDWDITDIDTTFYHRDRTLGYEMRIHLEDTYSDREEQLFYIGDLEYGIDQQDVDQYLDSLGDRGQPIGQDQLETYLDDTVTVEEWIQPDDPRNPPLVKDQYEQPAEDMIDRIREQGNVQIQLHETASTYSATIIQGDWKMVIDGLTEHNTYEQPQQVRAR